MVRRAVAADVDSIAAIVHATAQERIWIGASPEASLADLRAYAEQQLANPNVAYFASEVDGAVNGALSLENRNGRAELFMVVASNARGTGVGTALVAAALEWAVAHEVYKISLECWPHNAAAIALYRKFGFADEGVRRRQYRRNGTELWDSLLMGLVLDETSPGCPL